MNEDIFKKEVRVAVEFQALVFGVPAFETGCSALKLLVHGKTPPPCRGGGPQGRRGLPPTLSSRMAHKRVVTTHMANRTAIMAAAWHTKESLRPCGRETPSAPSGLVPLRGGTVLLPPPVYNNVCSPPRVRIRENPCFFWKKVG